MKTATHVTAGMLAGAGLDADAVSAFVRAALAEDLAWGPDITTDATIPADATATADVVAKAAGTLAGVPVACLAPCLLAADQGRQVEVTVHRRDGERVAAGDPVITVTGPTRALLTAERTMLNLLCQLSGVATLTSAWADAVAGTPAKIRDTRKTVPGLRTLQKYAVRCGGGVNHRMGLGDAALIKDNHDAAGSVSAAYQAVRRIAPDIAVEVECDTLDQVREAIAAGADLVLLDNMSPDQLRSAVQLGGQSNSSVHFEASGELTLTGAAAVAATGVDYLAVGALTHSAPALDLGLDLREVSGR
jgi:nicotinate-nucleotide pyrophosphorylase (carboxylating)